MSPQFVSGLIIAGYLLLAVGAVWFLVAAFMESILWGLGCMFIPFVGLFFLILHWNRAAKPFLLQLAGAGCFLAAILIQLQGR
jgi:hypothetical protein